MFYFCHSFSSSFQVLQPQAHTRETARRVLSELTQQMCGCLQDDGKRTAQVVWIKEPPQPSMPSTRDHQQLLGYTHQKDHSQSVLQTSSKSTCMAGECILPTGFKSHQHTHPSMDLSNIFLNSLTILASNLPIPGSSHFPEILDAFGLQVFSCLGSN